MRPPLRQDKEFFAGTHRVVPPADTLARIRGWFDRTGITRLADVTMLDVIGIPVFQAVRPNSKNLSVSQGKGQTADAARVSAAMEAIELWHAEDPSGERITATAGELVGELGYEVSSLALTEPGCFHGGLQLDWVEAVDVAGRGALLPLELITLDQCIDRVAWRFPVFRASSNGLASGNTWEEAVLHGLCEVLEREAVWQHKHYDEGRRWRDAKLDLSSVTDAGCRAELDVIDRAGMAVFVCDLSDTVGMPCFDAMITSEDFAAVFGGHGCHPDAGVALSRAVTEAVQSRLTAIAGSRDDLKSRTYRESRTNVASDLLPAAIQQAGSVIDFADVESVASADIIIDMHSAARAVHRLTGIDPIVFDHTRPDIGIPVVHVIAPGLHFGSHL